MFRKNKHGNKAKLEHKLYLARENPEPVFDLSDCDLHNVPHGIYSLCRVFLKESLRLENNNLSSLSGGGQLKDLHLLKIVNLSNNSFSSLSNDIYLLTNLQEIYISNNQLKKLPENISKLQSLRILDVSNNVIKVLPENIGNLVNLIHLNIAGNGSIKSLPKSICNCQRLQILKLDSADFIFPPTNIVENGTEAILKYICDDVGIPFSPPALEENPVEVRANESSSDRTEARIWELERIKQQKVQKFLEIEKNSELQKKQEIELANTSKAKRDKLLAALTAQQNQFDFDLNEIQHKKDSERFRLIEQLQEAENNADIAIKQLLSLNNEPLSQLLEQEKQEEERLLVAINRYNETLRKDDILAAMQDILEQESKKFKEFNQNRIETSQTILEQETETDSRLLEVLQNHDEHKAELVNELKKDNDLQRIAVGTLLERGDARSWGLLQQVKLVEAQLAALTYIEIDRKKLQMDQHMSDLYNKRLNLSKFLVDLLEQQKERRLQLLSTLQTIEKYQDNADDFWLKQYQRLVDKLPEGLSHAQKNINPALAQALLMKGVIHCLPFLAKLTQCQCDTQSITDNDLLEAGITSGLDRMNILDAFQIYKKEKSLLCDSYAASAPSVAVEEASAPLPDQFKTITSAECVICLDCQCQVIFLPCGHLCCCCECSVSISECPLCRTDIGRKMTITLS